MRNLIVLLLLAALVTACGKDNSHNSGAGDVVVDAETMALKNEILNSQKQIESLIVAVELEIQMKYGPVKLRHSEYMAKVSNFPAEAAREAQSFSAVQAPLNVMKGALMSLKKLSGDFALETAIEKKRNLRDRCLGELRIAYAQTPVYQNALATYISSTNAVVKQYYDAVQQQRMTESRPSK